MQLILYNVADDPRTISKTLGTGLTCTGNIKDTGSVDVVQPEILIDGNITGYNYAYIASFGRYYYIQELTQLRTGLCYARMRSDVLMSFKTEILALTGIAGRAAQDTKISPYIVDGQQRLQAYKKVQTISMGDLGGSGLYILVTAG